MKIRQTSKKREEKGGKVKMNVFWLGMLALAYGVIMSLLFGLSDLILGLTKESPWFTGWSGSSVDVGIIVLLAAAIVYGIVEFLFGTSFWGFNLWRSWPFPEKKRKK